MSDTERTAPTAQDIDNARRRQAIADRFRTEFALAEALACSVFGPGWRPTGRHFLLDKDDEERCRHTSDRPTPVATVISAEKDGMKRHFRVEAMEECESVEAGFGELLVARHPTKGFEHRGQWCRIHRFSLCWGWYEADYSPQTAEQLAAAREKRQAKAVEKEAAEHPLFAEQILAEGYVEKNRRGR